MEKLCRYLFVYFVGNRPEEERLHFAVSTDGLNFKPLCGNRPVITQTLGKGCVRDPYILRGENGGFYIVGTDMRCEEGWLSNHSLVSWRSDDLVNWTDETLIDMRNANGLEHTTRAWAPQAIWDSNAGAYMLYWANSTAENDDCAIYYAHTLDFKTITKPRILYARDNIQTIDADIIFNSRNNKYYLYFKHDEDQKIAYTTSDSLTGPYSEECTVCSHAQSGVEGSEVYPLAGTGKWIMIMDEYGRGRFNAEISDDLESFTPIEREKYNFDFSARHGSVMLITQEEYDRLVSSYGF